MTSAAQNKDQQHPLWQSDRAIINNLLAAEPNDYNLAELARLRIRYHGFPGARDIQTDLDQVLQRWSLTEAELYQQTRQIHGSKQVYQTRSNKGDLEDWS